MGGCIWHLFGAQQGFDSGWTGLPPAAACLAACLSLLLRLACFASIGGLRMIPTESTCLKQASEKVPALGPPFSTPLGLMWREAKFADCAAEMGGGTYQQLGRTGSRCQQNFVRSGFRVSSAKRHWAAQVPVHVRHSLHWPDRAGQSRRRSCPAPHTRLSEPCNCNRWLGVRQRP